MYRQANLTHLQARLIRRSNGVEVVALRSIMALVQTEIDQAKLLTDSPVSIQDKWGSCGSLPDLTTSK